MLKVSFCVNKSWMVGWCFYLDLTIGKKEIFWSWSQYSPDFRNIEKFEKTLS